MSQGKGPCGKKHECHLYAENRKLIHKIEDYDKKKENEFKKMKELIRELKRQNKFYQSIIQKYILDERTD